MRAMTLKVGPYEPYSSTFNPKTGQIIRVVDTPRDRWADLPHTELKEFQERYPQRRYGAGVFSPVPETVDISITNRCGFGCTYCYQDSTATQEHAPKQLVETVLKGFDQPPYQMAIGGGEPTGHPDFEYIVRTARELGTVPNYTTAGHLMSPKVIKVTNDVCGGVAMTFHAFRGIDWFVKHYLPLRDKLKIQLNVHLIADNNVATNLNILTDKFKELGPLNLVLLAFYANVGRSTKEGMMSKRTYMKDLPDALRSAMSAGTKISFSEGLLPYFLSRPELGIETRFAMRTEGLFSCYFDPTGRISRSSFSPPWRDEAENAFSTRSQVLWDKMYGSSYGPSADGCYGCQQSSQCNAPQDLHTLACALQPHNEIPLKEKPVTPVSRHLRILEDDDL